MIIFELLTLQMPYSEVKQNWKVSQLIIDGISPELPSHAETTQYQPLVTLFHKCTSRNPLNRPNASKLRIRLKALSKEGASQAEVDLI